MFDWYYTDYGYLFSPIIKQLLELLISSLDVVVAAHIVCSFACSKTKYSSFYTKWSWVCLIKIFIFSVSHNNIKDAFGVLNVDTLFFMLFNLVSLCLLIIWFTKLVGLFISFAKSKNIYFVFCCCITVILTVISISLFGNTWCLLAAEFVFYYLLNYIVFAVDNLHIFYESIICLISF